MKILKGEVCMKKLGKSLLVASLLTGVANATGSTNKTFFSGRPVGVNLAMEGTTWHTQINRVTDPKDPFDSAWQITGFYQENTNKDSLGEYFGFQNKNVLVVDEVSSNAATNVPAIPGIDIDHRNFFHSPIDNINSINSGANGGTAKFTATMELEYAHEAAGIRVDYQQDLDHFMKGLYCKVRAPFVWQSSGINLKLSNSVTATVAANGSTQESDTTTVSVASFFSGNLTQTNELPTDSNNTAQNALAFAKIDGQQDTSGLADVDVLVGWSFKETESSHAGGHVGITIPTGPTADGRFLGHTPYGNGGHIAVGAGLDSTMRLWESGKSAIDVDFVADWRFLFKNREVRTLGLKNEDLNELDWGHYQLLGVVDSHAVFPAANILTREVKVSPGNQVDARLGLAYRNGGLAFDLGYNVFAKEAEVVEVVNNCFNANNERFGRVAKSFSGTDFTLASDTAPPSAGIAATQSTTAATSIGPSQLTTEPAQTPSQVTHKIYGGLGYAFEGWETPAMIGLGASYEGHTSQAGLDNWSIWGKIGLSF